MGTSEETKKCPYCAEDIKTDAIVCRFCGRELDPEAVRFISQYVTRTERPERQPTRTEPTWTIDPKVRGLLIVFLALFMILAGAYVTFVLSESFPPNKALGILTMIIGAAFVVGGLRLYYRS